MQIGRKMTDLEAVEVLSVVLEHPVYIHIHIYYIFVLHAHSPISPYVVVYT